MAFSIDVIHGEACDRGQYYLASTCYLLVVSVCLTYVLVNSEIGRQ